MLEGAERTIHKHNVTKEDLYPHIIGSHQRASAALDNPYLQSYIIPITIDGKRCIDECIRPTMNEKLLSRMKPLLGADSITNAGNACLTHDGAAFVYLSNKKVLLKFIALNLGQEILSLVRRALLKVQKAF